VYAGVRQITNWIFINWARWIGIEYSIVGMIGIHGLAYLIVGMTRLVGSELNIQ
jgi:hypothetical protein